MGAGRSKVSNVAEEMGAAGGKSGSVIDKLTEAQLDEFREAFNSFDKVRCAPPILFRGGQWMATGCAATRGA